MPVEHQQQQRCDRATGIIVSPEATHRNTVLDSLVSAENNLNRFNAA
jgi:hypothetical protein